MAKTGVYINSKDLLSFHELPYMPMLFHVSPPFHLITPEQTKKRQTPIAHSLRASTSRTLPSQRPRFPSGGFVVPKLPRIPAFEMLSRKPKHMSQAKAHFRSHTNPRVPSSYRNNKGAIMPSSISRLPVRRSIPDIFWRSN